MAKTGVEKYSPESERGALVINFTLFTKLSKQNTYTLKP